MKRIISAILIILMITTISTYAQDITLASVLGDVSRGNHPLAGLEGTDIIVPRPEKSEYEPIQVLDTQGVKLSDISGHWAEENIRRFVDKGYIAGYEDGTFRPDNPVTWAEFATIAARFNLKPVRFKGGIFYTGGTRYNEDKWYYSAMLITSENGVFSEAGKRIYGAYSLINSRKPYYVDGDDDALTEAQRQYVALYLANMLEYKESEFVQSLSYNDISEIDTRNETSCTGGISRMAENEIITGYPDNTFRPTASVSRAELVAILTRMLDKYSWDMDVIHDNLYGNYNMYEWQEEKELLELVNTERKEAGINELKYDPNLTALARIKAIDIHINDYFSHTSPIFGDPVEMTKKFDISYCSGENITTDHGSAKSAHSSWKGSKGHYDNYMKKTHKSFGGTIGDGCSVEIFGSK